MNIHYEVFFCWSYLLIIGSISQMSNMPIFYIYCKNEINIPKIQKYGKINLCKMFFYGGFYGAYY